MSPLNELENIVIHIGWPKTATRSLRQSFFQVHPDINAVVAPRGFHYSEKERAAFCLIRALRQSPHRFAITSQKIINDLLPILFDSDRLNIVAAEALAIGATPYNDVCLDAFSIGNRLKILFPNAKIAMNIRSQLSILQSTHIQLFSMMSDVSPDFDTFIQDQFKLLETSVLPYYEYDSVVEHYQRTFGKERVAVFVHEKLNQQFDVYTNDLSQLTGIEVEEVRSFLRAQPRNQGSQKKRSFRMLAKTFLYQSALKRPFSVFTFIRNRAPGYQVVTDIENFYRNSNRRLSNLMDEDLSTFGYYH